jgi:hypothetical protein
MNELGPVFIGGLDRSGKTTLRAYLHSHPRICIPPWGSNMWTYFYQQYGDLRDRENFERCLDAMLHYKHVRLLEPDAELIRDQFRGGEQTYARLFELFLRQYAERQGKPRWGAQTGLIERYADEVFGAYPAAKMIQMIRDPRDRYAGSLALWPNGRARAGGAAARWLYTTRLAQRNRERYPHRYLVVRFEDMVLETEATIRRACDFLGEEFHSEMLDMPGAVEHREKLIRRSHGDPDRSPLSPEYIGIYRDEIPTGEWMFIQDIGRRGLTDYGYPLERRQLTPRDRLKYTMSTWPLNVARMLAWLGLEAVQHNLPAYFGRTPGANMFVERPSDREWTRTGSKGMSI